MSGTAPIVSWLQPLALFLVVAILGVTAHATWRTVQVRRERLLPHQAVNRLVLARACAFVGALAAGGYLGYALSWLGVDAELADQRLVRSLVAAAGQRAGRGDRAAPRARLPGARRRAPDLTLADSTGSWGSVVCGCDGWDSVAAWRGREPLAAIYPAPMTSPSGRPTRRRQRSTRVLAAVVLLAVAGVLVAGAAVSGSWLLARDRRCRQRRPRRRGHPDHLHRAHRVAARRRPGPGRAGPRLPRPRRRPRRGAPPLRHRRRGPDQRPADPRSPRSRARSKPPAPRPASPSAGWSRSPPAPSAPRPAAPSSPPASSRPRKPGREAVVRVIELEHEVDVLTAQWQARETQRKHA